MAAEGVLFERRGAAVVAKTGWPVRLEVADQLLLEADPAYVQVQGDCLRFTVANGTARYHLVARPAGRPASVWERDHYDWQPPGEA